MFLRATLSCLQETSGTSLSTTASTTTFRALNSVIPAFTPVIPALATVAPALTPVIPAKAGIHSPQP